MDEASASTVQCRVQTTAHEGQTAGAGVIRELGVNTKPPPSLA